MPQPIGGTSVTEGEARLRQVARPLITAGNALAICGLVSLVASGWFIIEEWSFMRDNPGAQLAPVLMVGGLGIFVLALGATIAGVALRSIARVVGLENSGG